MVRAILEGRKTQTRRVIKPQPEYFPAEFSNTVAIAEQYSYVPRSRRFPEIILDNRDKFLSSLVGFCPYGKAGDRLWVRETWQHLMRWHATGKKTKYGEELGQQDLGIFYRADGKWDGKWKPSIYMPRWASRILLEVTDVRVERVQEISGNDILAEGMMPCGENYKALSTWEEDLRRDFASLWDSINKKRGFGWDKNPWVWAVSFRRTDA